MMSFFPVKLLKWNQNQVELSTIKSSHTLQILNHKWRNNFLIKQKLHPQIATNLDPGLVSSFIEEFLSHLPFKIWSVGNEDSAQLNLILISF